jgi:phosphoribosylanthranilate isomerase
VDPVRNSVATIAHELGLDLLQFHGTVDTSTIDSFPAKVILALRPENAAAMADLGQYSNVWGFLFDRAPAGVFGGSGRSWSYERIAGLETDKPVLVAGGLTPDNVADAIRRSGAPIVDVCSGVEAAPGIKDEGLMKRFFSEVSHAEP